MSTAEQTAAANAVRLPALRRDLEIALVANDRQSFPSAIVSDPIRGGYFRLSWPESGIILMWQRSHSRAELSESLRSTYGLSAREDELAPVIDFAIINQLTETDQDGSWQRLARAHRQRNRGFLHNLLHNYLFFRVPLLRPEPLLKRMLPRLAFVYAERTWMVLGVLALVGLYLALRQWSAVVAAARDALRVDTIALYAVALIVLKGFHELGHALTTVRYGCRVPSMGVALMLGVPVLYTDTTDSWRLARRAERLTIVFAGIGAELIIAIGAILVWCFLPDGTLRTICFAFATASIVMSIVVNLNPFMRFDGYFALSDHLEVPNLQERAFALGLWRMREFLFDLRLPPPELLAGRLQRTLIQYALLTAIYRLVIYIGIAVMIYGVAGKAIGIVLGLVEILFFIAIPIASEIAVWWKMREKILERRRFLLSGSVCILLAAALVVPWQSTVEAPAVLIASREEAIHLPFPARLAEIRVANGQLVRAGDELFIADATDLQWDRTKTELEERLLSVQAARLMVSDKEREQRFSIESRLDRAREKLAAIDRRLAQLAIRAPFDGRVVDLDAEISSGIWLNEKVPLARLVTADHARARGLIAETDAARIATGAIALFIADDAAQPSEALQVASIAPASNGRIAELMLAERHGGPVIAGEARGGLVTRHGYLEVTFEPTNRPIDQVVRGVARIKAEPVSPLTLMWRGLMRVMVREQSF